MNNKVVERAFTFVVSWTVGLVILFNLRFRRDELLVKYKSRQNTRKSTRLPQRNSDQDMHQYNDSFWFPRKSLPAQPGVAMSA